ncbi:unnamed protein product [Orchesella dallaii]|uniref:Uncharacterized protein n=1 Tax=Orchesella dallaii TaxID=48710 RepID=A0ABP1RUR6_9HEXA
MDHKTNQSAGGTPTDGFSIVENGSSTESISILQISYNGSTPVIKKVLTIHRETKIWNANVDNSEVSREIRDHQPDITAEINAKEDASKVLTVFRILSKCIGISGFPEIDSCSSGIYGNWFAKTCVGIGREVVCRQCKTLHNVLRNRFYRTPKKKVRTHRKACNSSYYRQRISTLELQRNAARLESKKLNKYLATFEKTKVKTLVASINIPKNMKTALLQSLQVAQRKSLRGARLSLLVSPICTQNTTNNYNP